MTLQEKIKVMDELFRKINDDNVTLYLLPFRIAWQELKAELSKEKYTELEKAYEQGIYDCAREEAVCHFCVNGAAELEAIKIENERLKAMLSILSGKVKCITSDMDDNLPCNQYSNCEDCKIDWAYKLAVNKETK